ncbi:PTH2-domain-containing protein [Exidia glandulosa HHB12029]|uniref:peptidyl-tRNA hydrolase n=2 Tax=Exidia glandulosa HHB12029 TaxID=1314781 RepID=A0A165PGM5_EXIGL|nr:PTH2-domain-containing protein [Exidia glandulosa HHB12029]
MAQSVCAAPAWFTSLIRFWDVTRIASTAATYLALIITSAAVGYWAGVGSTLPITRGASAHDEPDNDSGEDSDTGDDDGLEKVTPGAFEECKMVLVVRTDLGMTKGKIAAQHATLACYKALSNTNPKLLRHWEVTGQAKIALQCSSEEELLMLQAVAKSLNLCARSIQDAGRTQIAAGSTTVLGIGPGPVRLINQVTGKLKLL